MTLETTRLSDHFHQLRTTLLKSLSCLGVGIIFAYCFHREIFAFITYDVPLIATSPLEGFFVSMQVSFYAGLLVTSPLWLFFLIRFLLPGLTIKEKRWIAPALIVLFVFGVAGLFFALKSLLPLATTFFAAYNVPFAENLWSLSSYLSFVVTLSLSLLLGSQLVGLFFLLVHFGVFSYAQLKEKRKIAYLFAFILGAILTPPDVPSQLVMATFLIGCYEVFLLYAYARTRLCRSRGS